MLRRTVLRRAQVLVDTTTHKVSNGTIALVTLNNAATRNSMTESMGDEFSAAMKDLSVNKDIRAVVLTGAGSAFSAGGDMAFLQARLKDTPEGNIKAMIAFYYRFLSLRQVPVPIIAALNGPAIGAGFCVALACDMRVAAEDAKLAVNFTRLGIHPGMGATYSLPRLVGNAHASRLLLTGDMISGADAYRMGIVVDAKPAPAVLESALTLAKSVASASKVAVVETVKTLRGSDEALHQALIREAEAQAVCYTQGKDLAEALTALKEKRSPSFQ
jgi:enoyl-CoA hydratase/carnithine racemase